MSAVQDNIQEKLQERLQAKLRAFGSAPLHEAAIALFETLGYKSKRRFPLELNTPDNFVATFGKDRPFSSEQALLEDWLSVDFLFQLTDSEVQDAFSLKTQGRFAFDSANRYDGQIMQSYLFIAIELRAPQQRSGAREDRAYSRTELSGIIRAVNRLFDIPVMILFRHGDTLTLAIIRRRLHRRDESKDVLEKVTLIKDIRLVDPHRAHLEVLSDLSLDALHDEFHFHNFPGLHAAWEKRLDSYALNERFYREVANWYFWALSHDGIRYPRDVRTDEQRSIFLIRLLTRLIFCWFLQEKDLIPRNVFRRRWAKKMLRDFNPLAGTYYSACLQNLFFATLNQEPGKRGFRKKRTDSTFPDSHRGVTNIYRHADLLIDSSAFEELLRQVPFVNGGLFDCLDQVFEKKEKKPNVRLDDFSEEKSNYLCLPNEIFFSEAREVDLSAVYDDRRRRREKVTGLIDILSRYKFTVEENTPLEQDIALDPELLGKVFENLLASYNEETGTIARKATGSFYTPREIVGYMVDEALLAYLESALNSGGKGDAADGMAEESRSDDDSAAVSANRLRRLFTAPPEVCRELFKHEEIAALVAAIDRVKIIDPACGSGAFLMGALHRLVELLQKLDPDNVHWRDIQRRRAVAETEETFKLGDKDERELRLRDINEVFEFNASDYGRKLYLIENCIYGVDIQPIGCQIAKLRFFITLIAEQQTTPSGSNQPAVDNRDIRPLPNLETKIVAANALIPVEKPQGSLFDDIVRPLRAELEKVRHNYFTARTPATKRKCRERDADLRAELADMLRENGLPSDSAAALAAWDPYDQNAHAGFFDPGWMFGLHAVHEFGGAGSQAAYEAGFDIVIGNPPYVRIQTLKQQDPMQVAFFKKHYESARKGNYDLYVVFVERGLQMLRSGGTLAYILPHKFFNAQYGEGLRDLLAKGRHLKHIVHFGDQQVFPGATNYVCLLFLAKDGADGCRFVRADDLTAWLQTYRGTEGSFPAKAISAAEWNFTVGRGSELFNRLSAMPNKLGNVADIFVGLQTSADDVFILDLVKKTARYLRFFSKSLNEEVTLESDLLHPLVSGTDVKTYEPLPQRQYILFPYKIGVRIELIPLDQLGKEFPRIADYLIRNRERLESRENGKLRGKGWHGYIYLKNMARQSEPKVCVPRLVEYLHAACDLQGEHFLDNVDVGGVVWKSKAESRSLQLLMALLNSAVLRWFFPSVSAPFRGGFSSANRQFLSQLPIAEATVNQRSVLARLVDYLLCLNRHFTAYREDKTARDALMLGWWEQLLNGLVYEIYFPDELHARHLHIFDLVEQTNLPVLSNISEPQRLVRLRELFETLYDPNHPLRGALHTLRSLETVRIIEGEA